MQRHGKISGATACEAFLYRLTSAETCPIYQMSYLTANSDNLDDKLTRILKGNARIHKSKVMEKREPPKDSL